MTNLTPLGLPYPDYHIDGLDDALVNKVCRALYIKRQGLDVVNIDMAKMVEYFDTDAATLIEIITWYEKQLISTKFKIG